MIRRERQSDGSTIMWNGRRVFLHGPRGELVEARDMTDQERTAFDTWADSRPEGARRRAWLAARDQALTARAPSEEQVRQAATRLAAIRQGAEALANAVPLAPATNAEALAAIQTLDNRQRQIGAAIRDMAAILRAVGPLTVAGGE